MIIPVLLAKTAWLFNLRISGIKCTFTTYCIVQLTPLRSSCPVPVTLLFTFHYVQYQAGVLKRVEVDHVAQRAVCQSRTEHRDIILKTVEQHIYRLIYRQNFTAVSYFSCPLISLVPTTHQRQREHY